MVDAAPSLRPAITNGLVHYWPDLWNARDEVTGGEGVVMALLPEVASGDGMPIEFGHRTGWVQLRVPTLPAAFSISCWLRWTGAIPEQPILLWCEGEGRRWALQNLERQGAARFGVITDDLDEAERAELIQLTPAAWHHLVLVQDESGRLRAWVDGRRVLDGTAQRQPPPPPEWLSVGNTPKGDQQWNGALTDLAWYDRPLADAEVQALHQAGRSVARPEPSSARRRAVGRQIEPQWNTNVARVSVEGMDHRRYTSEDDLPGNTIQALWQAQDGFLWVGTEYGLARFDGSRFLRFGLDNTPALAAVGCDIACLAEDGDGNVWAGLFSGLLRIRGTEFLVFTNGLIERFVLRVEPAGSNALWVAGYRTEADNRGACRLRRFVPGTGETTAVATVPGQVRQLVNTPEGVWIATEQPEMILFWDGKSPAPQLRFKVTGVDPLALVTAADGSSVPPRLHGWRDLNQPGGWWAEIQFGTNRPAFHWLRHPGAPEAQVNRWSGEPSHPAWVAAGHSLVQPADKTLSLVEFPASPLSPEFEVMCANREGGIWLGTWEDGLHLLRERPVKMVSTAQGLADNDVRSVCRSSRGGAWVATRTGPHHWLNGRAELITPGQMRCVAEDSAGRLWWGIQDSGEDSLRYQDSDGPHSFRLPGLEWRGPSTIHFAQDGTMWVVCEAGVTWVKPDWLPGRQRPAAGNPDESGFGRLRRGAELPGSEPFGIVEDHEGVIWVGSRDGGLYHIGKGEVAVMDRTKGFPGSLAVPALVDESGALWILSDAGIVRYRQGRFELIGPDNGVPRDLLFGMAEDDRGVFWIAGSRGIYRLARADLEAFLQGRLARVPSLALGLRDGLLTPECSASACPNVAKLADGSIAVATHNGLAVIDPSRVELNTRPLSVLFERVVANRHALMIPPLAAGGRLPAVAIDSRQRWAGGAELPAGSGRQLEIHYTAVSLLAADRVRFRYRLDGQDEEWSEDSAQRIAFYSNLRPGRYQFHVQASNAQGIWPEEEWILDLLIQPYFWETRTFQIAVALTVAVVLLLLHRQRVRVLRDLQELRHKQQFDGERARIAADMHDDLGAALTQIAILGEVAKRQVSNSPQATSLLDRITQSARDVTSRMSDLVWATNPRHDSLDNLSAHLREQAARMLQDTAVHPLFCFPESLPTARLSATVRRNVLLVMKEAINNALRHARASEIRVSFVADSERFNLVVEDNGCGFDSTKRRESGNGLNNMRRRIGDLGGEYELVSKPGAGTRVSLTVPFSGIGVQPRQATESM